MVMESRKVAPALRARLLRSYVPLRRDPSESVLSGTIPGLPGGNFLHPQIQMHKFKFSTKTCRYPADMVEYLSYGLRSVKIK